MLLFLALYLVLPNSTNSLNPGEFVKRFQAPVATASSSDAYACFIDAPNSHATTGCRKTEGVCSTGQAVCFNQGWNNSDYFWDWECSFETFSQCGLQWCATDAFCNSPNLCLCDNGLDGSPVQECYNFTIWSGSTTISPVGAPTTAPTQNMTPTGAPTDVPTGAPTGAPSCICDTSDEDYKVHFYVTLAFAIFHLISAIVAVILYIRKRRQHMNERKIHEDSRQRDLNSSMVNPNYTGFPPSDDVFEMENTQYGFK